MIAHSCTAFYQKGYAVLKQDATNGFEETKRAKMHWAIERRCPFLLRSFSKSITTMRTVGLHDTGDSVKVINIEEGCRMGCKLSKFGFAMYDSRYL